MKEEYYVIIGTWLVKAAIDYGVKKSKTTENTIDDFVFNKLSLLFNIFKQKKK